MKDYYDTIRQYHSNVPILLVANKVDLVNQRKINLDSIREKANDLNIPFIETSAKTKLNVHEALDWKFEKLFFFSSVF